MIEETVTEQEDFLTFIGDVVTHVKEFNKKLENSESIDLPGEA